MSQVCNCKTDGQRYIRCTCCNEYVIEGEFEAHRYSCSGRLKKKRKAAISEKSYTIVNDADGNDSFSVKAIDDADAAHKALKELGWWVAKP